MCRMESSNSGPRGVPQYGMRGWAAAFPVKQPQRSSSLSSRSSSTGQRRYKFEARLGKGRHQGTLYRARDEHGDVWAVEVVPQQLARLLGAAEQQKQKQKGGRKLCKLGGKLGLGSEEEEEEEAYTDFKTGARCFVSRLPRESMRQRLSRGAGGYGLGTVLRWAKQLATAVVKSNGAAPAPAAASASLSSRMAVGSGSSGSAAPGVLGLDSLWLDETDCILVGDYRPSSYAMPPSSSYGYQTESEEEEMGEDGEEALEEAEERVVGAGVAAEAKQAPAAASGVAAQQQQTEDEEAPQPRVLGEDEVKAFGVLLYQLATKTALPGDTAQAYDEILARAAARGAGDEASGKQALLELLRQALQQQRDAEAAELAGSGAWEEEEEEERAPRSEELAPLAELIADALMGKPQLASNLLAAVPSPRSSNPVALGASSSLPPLLAPAAADEDKSEPQPQQPSGPMFEGEEQKQQQQQQQQEEHAHALLTLARAAAKEQAEPSVPTAPSPSARSLSSLSLSGSCSPSADLSAEASAPLRPILGALRQTADAKLRHRALYGLKKLGFKAAEPAVVLALMEVMLEAEAEAPADPVARRMAAWTLGSLGEAAALMGAVPALIRALGDAEAGVRAAAAWALGGMGRAAEKQGALATLLHRSVKDEDAQVRELAGKSLARLKRVTGTKRRRPSESEGSGSGFGAISSSEDGAGAGVRLEAYYAKRRPISLASTTRSMAEASIHDHSGGGSGSSGLPPLIPIPPHQQPLTPLWVGAPGAPQFQYVHAPGTGQPVALAVAPGIGLSLSPSSGSLASPASSVISSAASSPTTLSAQQAAAAAAAAGGNMYYFVHVPVEQGAAVGEQR